MTSLARTETQPNSFNILAKITHLKTQFVA